MSAVLATLGSYTQPTTRQNTPYVSQFLSHAPLGERKPVSLGGVFTVPGDQ